MGHQREIFVIRAVIRCVVDNFIDFAGRSSVQNLCSKHKQLMNNYEHSGPVVQNTIKLIGVLKGYPWMHFFQRETKHKCNLHNADGFTFSYHSQNRIHPYKNLANNTKTSGPGCSKHNQAYRSFKTSALKPVKLNKASFRKYFQQEWDENHGF